MWLLITVCDREIVTEKFSRLTDAREAMRREMTLLGGMPEEAFSGCDPDAGKELAGEWRVELLGGYANNRSDFDWKIVPV